MPGSYLLTTSINVSPRDKNNTCSVIGCKITKKNPNNQEKYRKRVFITLLHSVEYQLFKGEKRIPIYPCGQPETHCICTLQTNENARLLDQWQTDACHMAAYSSFIFLVNFLTTSSSEWSIDSYMSRSQASALKYIWFQYFLLK